MTLRPRKDIATDGALGRSFKLDPAADIVIHNIRIGIVVEPIRLPIDRMPTKADAATSMAVAGIVAKGIAAPARNEACRGRIQAAGAEVMLDQVVGAALFHFHTLVALHIKGVVVDVIEA